MSPTVSLTITRGSLDGREYIFNGPCHCTVGRASDCDIQLPGGLEFLDVSRHHCLLEINPPDVRVRDLGSRNGTFLNGMKVGQRLEPWMVGGPSEEEAVGYELWDGDLLRAGHVVFRVRACPPALEGQEVPAQMAQDEPRPVSAS